MDIYNDLIKTLESNSNAIEAIKMSKYMQDFFPFYGIKSNIRKDVCKPFLKELKKNKFVDFDLVKRLFNNPYREVHYFAVDYLLEMRKYLTYNDIDTLKELVIIGKWWDITDSFDLIIGELSLLDSNGKALMLSWSKDSNIWIRRIAIDHQLSFKEKTDKDLLEQIIINNLGSKEFFINKAIGWSLREYSKVNKAWVSDFINRNQERLDKLSKREGSKYL